MGNLSLSQAEADTTEAGYYLPARESSSSHLA
jgi:hypothetical protein